MKTIHTSQAPEAIGPYSQAVAAGNLVYTSGQIPLIPETMTLKEGDIADQTEQAIANLAEILKKADSGLDRVIKTTCFLKNINDFSAFNAVYEKYFTGKPARSCVEVAALPKNALVEIEAIALKNEGSET